MKYTQSSYYRVGAVVLQDAARYRVRKPLWNYFLPTSADACDTFTGAVRCDSDGISEFIMDKPYMNSRTVIYIDCLQIKGMFQVYRRKMPHSSHFRFYA